MNELESESHEVTKTRPQEMTPFVYRHINGLVLNLNSIIKDDYFPGSRNTHLVGESKQFNQQEPQLEGAPNFRVSRFTNQVFGVGIPMIHGIENTVDYVQTTFGKTNIVRICGIE